jgi:hypothetical protein
LRTSNHKKLQEKNIRRLPKQEDLGGMIRTSFLIRVDDTTYNLCNKLFFSSSYPFFVYLPLTSRVNAHPSHATNNAPVRQADATNQAPTIVPIMFPIRSPPQMCSTKYSL